MALDGGITSLPDDTRARISDLALEMAADFEARAVLLSSLCESPIETLMMSGLMSLGVNPSFQVLVMSEEMLGAACRIAATNGNTRFNSIVCIPQSVHYVSEYLGDTKEVRVDFLMLCDVTFETSGKLVTISGKGIVVECDGFEWHDRDKQEFIRERQRCRQLLACVAPCVRFAGSEIVANPRMCALEAVNLARQSNSNVTFSLIATDTQPA